MIYRNNEMIYEIGDWVTGLDANSLLGNGSGQIHRQDFNGDFWIKKPHTDNQRYAEFCVGDGSGIYFRPASQKEINKTIAEEKIMVGEYEVSFDFEPKEWIKVGCQVVSKDLFLKIGKKAGWV